MNLISFQLIVTSMISVWQFVFWIVTLSDFSGSCHAVYYCSVACRDEDWSRPGDLAPHSHRLWCDRLQTYMGLEGELAHLPFSFANGSLYLTYNYHQMIVRLLNIDSGQNHTDKSKVEFRHNATGLDCNFVFQFFIITYHCTISEHVCFRNMYQFCMKVWLGFQDTIYGNQAI